MTLTDATTAQRATDMEQMLTELAAIATFNGHLMEYKKTDNGQLYCTKCHCHGGLDLDGDWVTYAACQPCDGNWKNEPNEMVRVFKARWSQFGA